MQPYRPPSEAGSYAPSQGGFTPYQSQPMSQRPSHHRGMTSQQVEDIQLQLTQRVSDLENQLRLAQESRDRAVCSAQAEQMETLINNQLAAATARGDAAAVTAVNNFQQLVGECVRATRHSFEASVGGIVELTQAQTKLVELAEQREVRVRALSLKINQLFRNMRAPTLQLPTGAGWAHARAQVLGPVARLRDLTNELHSFGAALLAQDVPLPPPLADAMCAEDLEGYPAHVALLEAQHQLDALHHHVHTGKAATRAESVERVSNLAAEAAMACGECVRQLVIHPLLMLAHRAPDCPAAVAEVEQELQRVLTTLVAVGQLTEQPEAAETFRRETQEALGSVHEAIRARAAGQSLPTPPPPPVPEGLEALGVPSVEEIPAPVPAVFADAVSQPVSPSRPDAPAPGPALARPPAPVSTAPPQRSKRDRDDEGPPPPPAGRDRILPLHSARNFHESAHVVDMEDQDHPRRKNLLNLFGLLGGSGDV